MLFCRLLWMNIICITPFPMLRLIIDRILTNWYKAHIVQKTFYWYRDNVIICRTLMPRLIQKNKQNKTKQKKKKTKKKKTTTINWQLPFLNQWEGEFDRGQYFIFQVQSLRKNVAEAGGERPRDPQVISRMLIRLSHRGRPGLYYKSMPYIPPVTPHPPIPPILYNI